MSLRSPQAIYSVLVKETKEVKCGKKKGKASSVKVSHFQDHLRDVVCSSSKMILLILDEMDQLDCRGQEILYSIFEWPSLPNSKLVLIGIANALDLTDRILPRLQARPNCRPQLLHFPPYDKDQLVTILTSKVQSTVSGAVSFDEKAIQFCARKVSSVHGDLRKAVDICRRAAEIVEGKSDKGEMKVTIPLVARVVSEVYGSSINSCGEGLPLQQKMAVCSFLLLTQGRKKKEVELGKFHDAYVKVCQKRKLKYESQQEFVDLCSLLETRGILALKAAKERRLTKVSLSLQEGDVEHALQDKALLSSVLEGGL
jgi:cell division control protein 6